MELVKKCVMAECDYYKEYGECSSVCSHYLIKPVLTNYDRIRNMSVEEMARFMATHIGHYEAPIPVKEIYRNAIDNKTGEGIIWIEAFKRWLLQEVSENE